jgi:superfamily II DNA/RNA helicase
MPPEITKLTEQFLHAPARIEVSRAATTATNIIQRLVKSGSKPWEKRAVLRELIRSEADSLKNAIIFCNRKVDVSELFRSLIKYDFDAGALHGDMDQRARMAMLSNFRDGRLKLLVASDVAARGLDIPDVSHVFNFDVPIHAEDYVHRIGRTGRAGRSGKSFTIATKADAKNVDAIEKLIGQEIEWHDGDLSTIFTSEGEDEQPRRGRARGRGDKRGEKRERKPRGERHATPSVEPATEDTAEQPSIVPAEVIEARRQRKQAIRSENAQRKTGPEEGRREERPARSDRSHRRHGDDESNTVIGFGDDMPAFMKVAVKV